MKYNLRQKKLLAKLEVKATKPVNGWLNKLNHLKEMAIRNSERSAKNDGGRRKEMKGKNRWEFIKLKVRRRGFKERQKYSFLGDPHLSVVRVSYLRSRIKGKISGDHHVDLSIELIIYLKYTYGEYYVVNFGI